MRRYLTTFGRWPSPKAVAGESYGGQRVAALSKMLMEDYDINLNRAVMISPALRAGPAGLRQPLRPDQHDDDAAVPGGHRGFPPPQRPAGGPGRPAQRRWPTWSVMR
jgi:hypothetical protein